MCLKKQQPIRKVRLWGRERAGRPQDKQPYLGAVNRWKCTQRVTNRRAQSGGDAGRKIKKDIRVKSDPQPEGKGRSQFTIALVSRAGSSVACSKKEEELGEASESPPGGYRKMKRDVREGNSTSFNKAYFQEGGSLAI